MKYTVQQVKMFLNEPEVLEIRDVFQSDDHDEVMCFWTNHASGVSDYDGAHENQNGTIADFYRIVESW